MRKSAFLFALFFTLAAGCGGAGTPPPEGPAGAAGEAAATTADQAKAEAKKAAPEASPVGKIVGTLTFDSIDNIMTQGTNLVRPQLPPAFQPMANPQVLKAQLFAMIKAPELEAVLDTTRPLALAIADPKRYEGKGFGPVVVAIPLKDPNGLIDFMAKKAKSHETLAGKVHLFTMDKDPVYLILHEGTYAILASDQALLMAAVKTVAPLLQGKPGHLAQLRLDMEELYRLFGPEIEKGIAEMKRELVAGDPKSSAEPAMKMFNRWIGYAKGTRVIDMALGIRGNDLFLETALGAISGSEFAKYMSKLNPGKPWGLKYIPADCGIVGVARQNPETLAQDIDEAVDTLVSVLSEWIPVETIKGWRGAMQESIKHFAGTSAGGVYATADGGIGFAGANQVKDGKAAQEAMRKWVAFLSKEVKKLIDTQFRKEIDKVALGANISLKLRKNKLRVGGVKGDLFQIKIKWPRLKDKKEREAMAKVKKGMAKVIGKDVNMGMVVVDDVMLTTFGKDYKKRMGQLVAIAKGKKPDSELVKTLAPYTDGRDVYGVAYSQLEILAEQVLRVADKLTTIPPDVRDVMAKVMPGPNTTVPVAIVASQKGETLTFEGSVSANLVGMIARGAMHAMSKGQRRP